jgi:hypothetical protein
VYSSPGVAAAAAAAAAGWLQVCAHWERSARQSTQCCCMCSCCAVQSCHLCWRTPEPSCCRSCSWLS